MYVCMYYSSATFNIISAVVAFSKILIFELWQMLDIINHTLTITILKEVTERVFITSLQVSKIVAYIRLNNGDISETVRGPHMFITK